MGFQTLFNRCDLYGSLTYVSHFQIWCLDESGPKTSPSDLKNTMILVVVVNLLISRFRVDSGCQKSVFSVKYRYATDTIK